MGLFPSVSRMGRTAMSRIEISSDVLPLVVLSLGWNNVALLKLPPSTAMDEVP